MVSLDVFVQMLRSGGAIVSSNECSEMEIVNARATERFFVDADGFGYVWRTPDWLESREQAYKLSQGQPKPSGDLIT